jgi:hypothetical protein
MPFVCGGIVIDSHRRAKARAAIRAARDHHVCAVAVGWRPNATQHVNVIIRGSTRTVRCQKYLRCQTVWIHIPADPHATEIDLSHLFKDWRLITNLRVTGANAPKSIIEQILSADEQIAVGIHVRGSMYDAMGNIDRTLPGHTTVRGTAKFAG